MEYLGFRGTLIHEKNLNSKISCQTPFKFFDADPGSGMETVRIRDPGWKKVGSGIRDKYPGSATFTILNRSLKLAIYAPLVRPPPPPPVGNVFDACRSITRAVGGGWALEIET